MRVFAVLSRAPALGLAFLSLSALAAEPAPSQPGMPVVLQTLVKQGAEIRYLGKDGGLDGWVTIKNGQEQYFYVTPDQQAIVLGILFNNKGDVVTMRQVDALRKKDPSVDTLANAGAAQTPAPETAPVAIAVTPPVTRPAEEAPPKPAKSASPVSPSAAPAAPAAGPTKAQQLYADVEAANWIALGQKSAPAIYSFIDPQCPHCHDMIDDFRNSGYLDKGQVQLRLIPVGLMNDTSLKQAANLLAAKNPALLLYKHLAGDKDALMADPNPNTQNVQRNIVLMQSWKLDVTPFSIYKTKSGEIKIIRGRPEDLKSLVANLK